MSDYKMSSPPAYKDTAEYPSAPPASEQAGYGYAVPYPQTSQYPVYPPGQVPPAGTFQNAGYTTGQPPYPAAQQPPYPEPNVNQSHYPPAQPYQSTPRVQTSNPYQAAGYGYGQDDGVPAGDEATGWVGGTFSDKKIRQQFIKKVYLILMSQLFFTFGVVCLFYFVKDVKDWVRRNSWFYWCSYAVFLVTYITLVCCDNVRRRWPANFICLTIFTMAFSYIAATITSYYDINSVMIALGITAAVCLSISLFAIQTKIDFTMCSGLIFALAMVLFFFGIACMITYFVSGPNYILQCVYGGLAAIVFSLFLVFDTQMVVGGSNRRYQLSPEEYIYGALQLYVDVVNLFIIILGLVGGKRG
jgi:hypothetical protein